MLGLDFDLLMYHYFQQQYGHLRVKLEAQCLRSTDRVSHEDLQLLSVISGTAETKFSSKMLAHQDQDFCSFVLTALKFMSPLENETLRSFAHTEAAEWYFTCSANRFPLQKTFSTQIKYTHKQKNTDHCINMDLHHL